MQRARRLPIALTIAGSDSGGGAGVQADLKTFAALGVYGTSAITCLTAQNPAQVIGIQACRAEFVRRQIEAVLLELHPAAVKTGMLYSAEIIRVVVDFFRRNHSFPLVVDPVMAATSGAPLLKYGALQVLKTELLPRATLVTPNVPEAELLVGRPLRSIEDLRMAAREIYRQFKCAVLVKGGHVRGGSEAADILHDGRNEWLLATPFVKGVNTHGTGCTYSAAITGYLASGRSLLEAVRRAKEFMYRAIAHHRKVGRHAVLNWFWPT